MIKTEKIWKLFASMTVLGLFRICEVEGSLDPLAEVQKEYERVQQEIAMIETDKNFFERTNFKDLTLEQRGGIVETIRKYTSFSKNAEKTFNQTGDVSTKLLKLIAIQVGNALKTQKKVSSDLLKHIEEIKTSQEQEAETEAFMADPAAIAKMEASRKYKEQDIKKKKEAQQQKRAEEFAKRKAIKERERVETVINLYQTIMEVCTKKMEPGVERYSHMDAQQIFEKILKKFLGKMMHVADDVDIAIGILDSPSKAPDVLRIFVSDTRINVAKDYVMRAILAILAIRDFSKNHELVKIFNVSSYIAAVSENIEVTLKDTTNNSEEKEYNLLIPSLVTVDDISNSIERVYGNETTVGGFYAITDTEDSLED